MELEQKIAYETPEVVKHGSFEEITAGNSTGSSLDKTFPQGTPFNQLTFS